MPVELGFQIFQPLLIHALSSLKIAPNLTAAKRMISTSQPRVKACLKDLTSNEIVLLNRAPTLHRMNFQAFYPIITDSKAIALMKSADLLCNFIFKEAENQMISGKLLEYLALEK